MIKILKKNIKETIILILLSSFFVLASTVGALLIAKSLDFLLKQNFYQFLYYILLSFIAWISGLFSNYIRRIKEETLTQKICTDLRSAAIKKLVSEFSSNSKQDKFVNYDEYVNLCTNDIEIISDGIGCFFELVSILSGVIFSSLALFSFHYIIVLTSILLGLIILVIPKFFDDKISDGINNVSEKYKELQSNSFNMINGSNILNNYSSLKLMLGVIKNHSISLGNDKITLEKNLSKLWILINFLNTFSQVLLIFISGWLAYNKIVSYGIIISVGNLSNQLFNSLQSFGEVYSKYILSKSILRKYDLDLQVKKVD
ncbi:ABC transporter transmembrane domain-containing protein, partial [Finegoldia magna]|uniref:ABC transporter transmembrane domain-containing protein n=1 Tax=Finegoldia magna TaxID=1260 RepID=UPI0028FE759E